MLFHLLGFQCNKIINFIFLLTLFTNLNEKINNINLYIDFINGMIYDDYK